MVILERSHIPGEFLGYRSGEIFELANGERWEQLSNVQEPVYRMNARVRILSDGESFLLDVEGTSSLVRVRRVMGQCNARWCGRGL
jgi:hypothetical protein